MAEGTLLSPPRNWAFRGSLCSLSVYWEVHHTELLYCWDMRPSGLQLEWALLLAGGSGCSLCLAASWDHVLPVPREGRQ